MAEKTKKPTTGDFQPIQEIEFSFRSNRDNFANFFSQFEDVSEPGPSPDEEYNNIITSEYDSIGRAAEEFQMKMKKPLDPNRTVPITQDKKDVVSFLLANKPTDKDPQKQKGIRGFINFLNWKMISETHLTPKEWNGLKEIYRVELEKRELNI